jgi:hypothetical protein
MELNWPTKGITAREAKQCSCSAVVHLNVSLSFVECKYGGQLIKQR